VTTSAVRVFVPPASCDGGRLSLEGEEANRVYLRGVRRGDRIVALDDSGWELTVQIERAAPDGVGGPIVERRLAMERRTKVTLYHGLLHPSDLRRLFAGATGLGVVRLVPLITDSSVVPALGADSLPEGEADWPRVVRHAAETSGRGRRPTVDQPMLMSHALDDALRNSAVLMLDDEAMPPSEALAGRPFSISLFCPPPGGFTPDERAQAVARNVKLMHVGSTGPDPVEPALSALEAMYAVLEGADNR